MTTEKFIAFMEKLLEKTKDGSLKWKRYPCPNPSEAWANSTKSFSCKAGTMLVRMLCSENFEIIQFIISYDESLPDASLDPDSAETNRVALRLANYVYDQFPNLENSIDRFLNDC